MKLTIPERFTLLGILPKEGDFSTLSIVRKLREALSFTEEEHAKAEITIEGTLARWVHDFVTEIPLAPVATSLIVTELRRLDEAKKLTDETYTLYQKFVGE